MLEHTAGVEPLRTEVHNKHLSETYKAPCSQSFSSLLYKTKRMQLSNFLILSVFSFVTLTAAYPRRAFDSPGIYVRDSSTSVPNLLPRAQLPETPSKSPTGSYGLSDSPSSDHRNAARAPRLKCAGRGSWYCLSNCRCTSAGGVFCPTNPGGGIQPEQLTSLCIPLCEC